MGPQLGASVIGELSTCLAGALARPLPGAVVEKAEHLVLDALAAMVSGSRLTPGELAIRYVRSQGGAPEAGVAGSDVVIYVVDPQFLIECASSFL